MRGRKSIERRPASLMRRLALIAGADVDLEASDARRGRQPNISMYFGIGLAGGAAAGVLALLTLHLGGIAPDIKLGPTVAAWTSWASPISAPAVAASRPVNQREPAIDAFEMTLQRTSSAAVPFPLRIVGGGEAVSGLVLRDLPPGVQLSRGERRDETTWVVNVAELPYLQVALADGAPSTFHVRIDLLARPDVAASSSIARVRVVDVPAAPRESAPPMPAAPAPAPVIAAADTPVAARTTATPRPAARPERPARPSPAPSAHVAIEPERQVVQPEAEREGRRWPEGASGLGAIARATERQVWWKLPAPTWSPFPDVAGR